MRILPTLAVVVAAAVLVPGCSGCGKGGAVCARPSDPLGVPPIGGDANADGTVDISDGVFVHRYLTAGGAEPPCGADVLSEGSLDHADGFAIWQYLFDGTATLAGVASDACDAATPLADAECGRIALGWESETKKLQAAPGRQESFTARVTLASDLDVQAWSLSIRAQGCSITGVDAAGTIAADVDDGGLQNLGFARSDVVDGGATSAVALSWMDEVVLPPSHDPTDLLVVTVGVSSPDSGCEPCTLSFEDGRQAHGRPVVNAVVHGGRSYAPTGSELVVEVCRP